MLSFSDEKQNSNLFKSFAANGDHSNRKVFQARNFLLAHEVKLETISYEVRTSPSPSVTTNESSGIVHIKTRKNKLGKKEQSSPVQSNPLPSNSTALLFFPNTFFFFFGFQPPCYAYFHITRIELAEITTC
jgi:hypothetical protein